MTRLIITSLALAFSTNVFAQDNYTLRVLSFEDSDGSGKWENLIDSKQYGGPLLYGPDGMGFESHDDAYKWDDSGNTFLSSGLCECWGMWCYWGGGHAVSDYGTAAFSAYGDYASQLTVFDALGDDSVTRTGHGHNGSKNFGVHYGYTDNSGFAMLTEETLPALTFSDGQARVIDHLWVTNTCYALACYLEGNGLTAKIGVDDWVKIVATGYNDGMTGQVEFYLCNGPDNIVREWTKFDLSALGEVKSVRFNITGSSDNGAGFSQPAYFAFDDVAVRFPDDSSGIDDIITDQNGHSDIYYDLMGRRVDNPTKGIYIVNGKKVLVK